MDTPLETPPPQWTVGERALVVLAVLALIAVAKITEAFIVPVIAGLPVGHGERNDPVVLGGAAPVVARGLAARRTLGRC